MLTKAQFDAEINKVNDRVFEEVFPLIAKIDDEVSIEVCAYFAVFINIVHALFYQGWTKEELLREVTDHHDIFLKDLEDEGNDEPRH